jgi:hypothetical protein
MQEMWNLHLYEEIVYSFEIRSRCLTKPPFVKTQSVCSHLRMFNEDLQTQIDDLEKVLAKNFSLRFPLKSKSPMRLEFMCGTRKSSARISSLTNLLKLP